MVEQVSRRKDFHFTAVARTMRCVKCGEEFPHVHLNDECLNCGGREWEKPEKSRRHWKGAGFRP